MQDFYRQALALSRHTFRAQAPCGAKWNALPLARNGYLWPCVQFISQKICASLLKRQLAQKAAPSAANPLPSTLLPLLRHARSACATHCHVLMHLHRPPRHVSHQKTATIPSAPNPFVISPVKTSYATNTFFRSRAAPAAGGHGVFLRTPASVQRILRTAECAWHLRSVWPQWQR